LADEFEAHVLDMVRRNDQEGFDKAQTDLYFALVSPVFRLSITIF